MTKENAFYLMIFYLFHFGPLFYILFGVRTSWYGMNMYRQYNQSSAPLSRVRKSRVRKQCSHRSKLQVSRQEVASVVDPAILMADVVRC